MFGPSQPLVGKPSRARAHAAATSFLYVHEPTAHQAVSSSHHLVPARMKTSFTDKDSDDAVPDTCYNKQGQVCNRSTLPVDNHAKELQESRFNALRIAESHGFCSDPLYSSQQACEDAGGEWRAEEGLDLFGRLQQANWLAATNRKRVEAAAAEYQKSFQAFDAAYKDYEKELRVWQQAVTGLEDDYSLYCRPFHDVTMECEGRFRRAMQWWLAREPLPACEIGVVTPYLRNASPKSVSSMYALM
eukprot:TRINITY_DN37554_c0_g1_i1.p1 TRINITY_DN37554_c0_g1~~TRINITY_DN37554_c0_g1_i1.p1  ORF type:complete len:245 (+),score=50.26 TRINITY_DN37554_c0_g1_i1:63-797(+)